jgi:hypothetical protein
MNHTTEPAAIPNQHRFHDAKSYRESLDSTIRTRFSPVPTPSPPHRSGTSKSTPKLQTDRANWLGFRLPGLGEGDELEAPVQQKSRVLTGSSDTRSTPENEDSLPEQLLSACHQLWGQGSPLMPGPKNAAHHHPSPPPHAKKATSTPSPLPGPDLSPHAVLFCDLGI